MYGEGGWQFVGNEVSYEIMFRLSLRERNFLKNIDSLFVTMCYLKAIISVMNICSLSTR